MTQRQLAQLRRAAYEYLDVIGRNVISPVWRVAQSPGGSTTDITLVCANRDHPADDPIGAYDCCPPVIEVWSEQLAAYLVALLNSDTDQER